MLAGPCSFQEALESNLFPWPHEVSAESVPCHQGPCFLAGCQLRATPRFQKLPAYPAHGSVPSYAKALTRSNFSQTSSLFSLFLLFSLFFSFFPLYSRSLLIIHSIDNSMHMPVSNRQSIPLPPVSFGNHKFISEVYKSVSVI